MTDVSYQQIPVHIITGFLGVGKTSCIQNLIKQKPGNERWAILVNEYGQQGIDGQLFDTQKVLVKQVAGGCACCDALLTFQTVLNQIIRFDQPDRIIIEPSGLGHVDNIVQRMHAPDYEKRLTLKGVTCVIDPRHLSQSKYRYHDLYLRQLACADVFIANKSDLASENDLKIFERQFKDSGTAVYNIEHGELTLKMIDVQWQEKAPQYRIHGETPKPFYTDVFHFNQVNAVLDDIKTYLLGLQYMRIKALIFYGEEIHALNISGAECEVQVFQSTQADQPSVIECIHDQPIDHALQQAALQKVLMHE